MTMTTNTKAITRTVATTKAYPKFAFCSAITPADSEYYARLKAAGIDTASICLHLSGYSHYKFATIHTNLARQAGMKTHAFMVTDLTDIYTDMILFSRRFNQLGYTRGEKITIWISPNKRSTDREEKIVEIIDLISNYHDENYIDIALMKRDIDDCIINLSRLPKLINLTIINCNAQLSGIAEAGTWVYTNDFEGETQLLAYDFYGFYTDEAGYQLSLVDTDYAVQKGDTWHSIARRHGIPLEDLLALNRAEKDDKLFAGQVVRIA